MSGLGHYYMTQDKILEVQKKYHNYCSTLRSNK